MKKAKLIALVLLLLIAAVVYTSLTARQSPPLPTKKEAPVQEKAFLVLDFGENEIINYQTTISDGDTAYSILEKLTNEQKIELQTQQYDFGIFVKSIGGKESTAELAWIYFINDEAGKIAADQLKLKNNDVVEWKYLEPNIKD